MKETQYEGKPCKHGHVNENGLTIRRKSNDVCVQCHTEYARRTREKHPTYKAYQKQYHAKLRKENPDKLVEYYNNTVMNGTRKGKLKDTKENSDVTYEELIAQTHNKTATMLFNNLRRKYLTENGELNEVASTEGFTTLDELDAALMLKAKLLVNPVGNK